MISTKKIIVKYIHIQLSIIYVKKEKTTRISKFHILINSKDVYCIWSMEDLLKAMDDRDGWREKESGKSMLSSQLDDDNDRWQQWISSK